MLHINNLRSALPLFKALGSDTRIAILELLYEEGPKPMAEISERLHLTGGALTPHIKMLSDAGLINIAIGSGRHGVQKICSAMEERIMIDPAPLRREISVYETEIGVGQFTDYEVLPTCGLATADHIIGEVDYPKYFASPDRLNCGIVWLGSGYLEYMVPNFLSEQQSLVEIQITLELGSESPGSNEDWPSDITFSLNGHNILTWTSPADFGASKGIYTPNWWNRHWNQHGMFKLITINRSGSFVDGQRFSDVTLQTLAVVPGEPMTLRISAPKDAKNAGGLTLYGRSFGNYQQDISVRMHYIQNSQI